MTDRENHPAETAIPVTGLPRWMPSACAEPLRPGDIVMVRYPSSENRRALEKIRPCLVLEADGEEVVVAFGTTRANSVSRARELHVVLPSEITHAGLWRPTRFLAWRTTRLSVDSKRFHAAPSGGRICGTLGPKSRRGLARLRAAARPDPRRLEPTGRARRNPVFLGGASR